MRILIILLFTFLSGFSCMAQSDLLVLKKNGKTIQSFYPGTEMHFSTDLRYYEAQITSIRNDSVYLVQYAIRRIPLTSGGVIIDTAGTFHFGINYKDIVSLENERKGFDWAGSGAGLFGGGVVLTTAGLISWILAKPNTRYYARPEFVIAGAAFAAAGYFLMKTGNKRKVIGKKYTLNYISLN
ncbi:MAG: hypothetical protein ABI290_03500 [Ginsengibacter sp.]